MTHFTIDEFYCPCGCKNKVSDISNELTMKLDVAREIAGIPFIINSGRRCKKHNKTVGGVDDSTHLDGEGVDIKTTSSSAKFKILDALISAGFSRFGIGKNFIHADVSTTKPQSVIWTY